MKHWARGAAMIAVLLVATVLGTAPASAAKPSEQTITYRGYTLSWSASDASDVTIVRTPGRPDSFPAKASDQAIANAKARVSSLAQSSSQSSTQATDSCNFVPDRFGAANFTTACDNHDVCYSSISKTDRATCDAIFYSQLIAACNQAYSPTNPLLYSCYAVATIYYLGVRLFGASFYDGPINN